MTEFEQALISRDELTPEEAAEIRLECIESVMNGANPAEVLYDYGLEPDYIFDIM